MSRTTIPALVTIGIPSYNRRPLLMRCIGSLLKGTYTNIQIVVSDDASPDDTWEALQTIEDPRLTCIRQSTNLGVIRNQQAVLEAAAGQFFMLSSDDDIHAADAIRRLVDPMLHGASGHPASAFGLSWCPCIVLDGQGKTAYTTKAGPACESSVDFMAGLYRGTRGPRTSSILYRTESAWVAGGFDPERVGVLCDTSNFGGAALQHPMVACIREPLLHYTVHAASTTSAQQIADWQPWARALIRGHVQQLHNQGDPVGAIRLARNESSLVANLTADLLFRNLAASGWCRGTVGQFWRCRDVLFKLSTLTRLLRDGWKIFLMPRH
jgi:glycosyltransferase involved in cell wall biosynthesis